MLLQNQTYVDRPHNADRHVSASSVELNATERWLDGLPYCSRYSTFITTIGWCSLFLNNRVHHPFLDALRAVCRVSRVRVLGVMNCFFIFSLTKKSKKQGAGPNSLGATLSLIKGASSSPGKCSFLFIFFSSLFLPFEKNVGVFCSNIVRTTYLCSFVDVDSSPGKRYKCFWLPFTFVAFLFFVFAFPTHYLCIWSICHMEN